jgi:hypothetical protein
MSEITSQIREGDKATIIQHCAVFGRMKRDVRKFRVEERGEGPGRLRQPARCAMRHGGLGGQLSEAPRAVAQAEG